MLLPLLSNYSGYGNLIILLRLKFNKAIDKDSGK